MEFETASETIAKTALLRLRVLYPSLGLNLDGDRLRVQHPDGPLPADLKQAISDILLRAGMAERDAPLRERLFKRLLGT